MLFAYPQGRIYLMLAFAVAILAVMELLRKRGALRRLARQGIHQSGMLVRPGRQIFKCALLMLVAALLGIAVLGPQWGWIEEQIPPRHGRDVLVVLDVSRSMLAEDVAPNRLERAKGDLRELAGFLERSGGYRIGLIAFAERAAVMCPLTSDYRCFAEELADASLDSLRIRGRAAWGDGTQIRQALERAGQMIDDTNAAYTDILLASDGDDMARETLSAAESLGRRGITVHTLGVGDSAHDALIPVRDNLGRPAHLRYRGELVRTHLQDTVLRAIAQTTRGRYFAADTSYSDLDRQVGELLAAKERLERQTPHRQRRGIHRFAWFVTPALVLLLLHSFLIDARRRGRAIQEKPHYFAWVRRNASIPPSQGSPRAELLRWPTLAALICIATGALATSAGPAQIREAWAAFRRGNELLCQSQQVGSNADPAALLRAEQQYQACLSSQTSMPDAGQLFANASHNLEMTKLFSAQLGRAGPNSGQTESSEARSRVEAKDSGQGPPTPPTEPASADKKSESKPNSVSASNNGGQPSSRSQQQQPSQEKSENCSTCLTGQNSSVNARKMKEGGQGPGPGPGASAAPGQSSADQTEQSASANDGNSSQGKDPGAMPSKAGEESKRSERGRGREPDARGSFQTERPSAKQKESSPQRATQGNDSGGAVGQAKRTQTMDPTMQNAVRRLQESIQRIEKRRGRLGSQSEPGPEDPANQKRYRDW